MKKLLLAGSLILCLTPLIEQRGLGLESQYLNALTQVHLEAGLPIKNTESVLSQERTDISSVLYLSANKTEDPYTKKGVEDAVRKNYAYENYTSNLYENYANSDAQVLILGGHHFAGTLYVFDNKINVTIFSKFPKNDNIRAVVFRGCHAVMNPDFLREEAEKHKFRSYTAEEFITSITDFAPNINIIVGYETKSRFEKDEPLIRLTQHLDMVESDGFKAFGMKALDLSKQMYEFPGHERDSQGNWTYNTHFHKKEQEGARMAFYLKEDNVWKYYSLDHPEGFEVK